MYGAAMSFAYHAYEAVHMMVSPVRGVSDAMHLAFKNPANPLTYTPFGRTVAASCELFERMTRRYGKPAFGLDETTINGVKVAVEERVVWERPFCKLVYFDRKIPASRRKPQPKVLLVAPMSGHYATLLRGTVEAFLPGHEVYITDWVDARLVPLSEGRFDLDDYIDYVIGMLQMLGPDTHVMAICQPSVPVIAAVARMEADRDPCAPRSMTLMGGPIDTRRSPTAVNQLAMERGTDWFRRNCITVVPFPSLGAIAGGRSPRADRATCRRCTRAHAAPPSSWTDGSTAQAAPTGTERVASRLSFQRRIRRSTGRSTNACSAHAATMHTASSTTYQIRFVHDGGWRPKIRRAV